MLKSCTSICCCFSCKKEVQNENVDDEKWKEKNKTPHTNPTSTKNIALKSSTDDDVRVICEANLQDILNNQNGSQRNMYRFVSSNESMSMSLHESIIEEEEIDDAEVCDSIVYVVDGESSFMNDHEHDSGSNGQPSDGEYNDNNSGSGYSSDVTIINANNIVPSSTQPPVYTNMQNANNEDVLQRQTEVDKYEMKDNSHGVQIKPKSSPSPAKDIVYKNTRNCDIKNVKLEHMPDESFSKHKSTICTGKNLINYACPKRLIMIYNLRVLYIPKIAKF